MAKRNENKVQSTNKKNNKKNVSVQDTIVVTDNVKVTTTTENVEKAEEKKTEERSKKYVTLRELIQQAKNVYLYNGTTRALIKPEINDKNGYLLLRNNYALVIELDESVTSVSFKDNLLNVAFLIESKNNLIIIRNLYIPQHLNLTAELIIA
jgi:hypothetical protein